MAWACRNHPGLVKAWGFNPFFSVFLFAIDVVSRLAGRGCPLWPATRLSAAQDSTAAVMWRGVPRSLPLRRRLAIAAAVVAIVSISRQALSCEPGSAVGTMSVANQGKMNIVDGASPSDDAIIGSYGSRASSPPWPPRYSPGRVQAAGRGIDTPPWLPSPSAP